MLVLSRKPLQSIMIGSDIRLTIVKVERNQVRLGIEAPRGVTILRDELVPRDRAGAIDDETSGISGVEILAV